ncbi:MAG: ABC-2 family transporter protein [Peptococcaceae bacterium]|jgi:ABC-2 type transport system permease protein|nr:ABC-2 family transporter protein [Peptococcaceae bacterium]
MKLYGKYFSMHLKSQMQYKVSFFLTAAGQFLVSFTAFLGVYFIFARFRGVDGFTYTETLLCFASVLMAFSLAEMFFSAFDVFPTMLGDGQFDRVLVRPRNVIFQVVALRTDFTRLGLLLQALLVLCYAIPSSSVVWTWDRALTLFLMVSCGALVFSGLFIIYAGFTFFTVEGLEFMNVLTYGGREHGRYPFSIYGDRVLKFLTYVIPLALVQYYPLLYLLGRETGVIYMLAPLFSLLFLLPCYAFFRFGLRYYKSTGS